MAFSLDQFYRLNRRALIWIILGVLIWLLRDFFGLIFLSFILAFISTPLARFGQQHLHLKRRLSIVIIYGLFLIAIVGFAMFVAPRVIREANTLLDRLPQIEQKLVSLKSMLVQEYPSLDPLITGYIRSALPDKDLVEIDRKLDTISAPLDAQIKALNEAQAATQALIQAETRAALKAGHSPLALIAMPADAPTTVTARLATLTDEFKRTELAYDKVSAERFELRRPREQELLIKAMMNVIGTHVKERAPFLIGFLWRLTATLSLALLFSFLITLDITRLTEELKSLRASRLHEFYEQTAQPVVRFAYVVGRAFQAQALIATANAVLTLAGMLVLGLPSLAMLTLIVFACSFVPVLGVFISTVPLLLVALNAGGLSMTLSAIVLVMVIHAIEAYLLNPLIYGQHLKLNPVLVLMILFIGHHAFGLWGMLLGVPVAYYFIHDVFGVPVMGGRILTPRSDKPAGAPLSALPRAANAEGQPGNGVAHPAPPAEEAASHIGPALESMVEREPK